MHSKYTKTIQEQKQTSRCDVARKRKDMQNMKSTPIMPKNEEHTEIRAADYKEQIISMLQDPENNDIRFLYKIFLMMRTHLNRQREKEQMFRYH